MATTTATCGITTGVEENMHSVSACGCYEDIEKNTHFFRGILIAIPAGLLLWAGLLRVAGEVLHRL